MNGAYVNGNLKFVSLSTVTPSLKEPYPGWVDSLNGPISLCVTAGTGILRTIHGRGSVIPDMIPVDFASNSFIVAAAFVGRNKSNDCPVYNCTTSSDKPISWTDFLEIGRKVKRLIIQLHSRTLILKISIEVIRSLPV